MQNSAIRLQDKTILLLGPFNGVIQALMRTLTELGADVAYVAVDTPVAGKYAEGVNEAREAHPDYGRAAHFDLPLRNAADLKEAIGQVVERLGRMEVLIDASPLSWDKKSDRADSLSFAGLVAQAMIPYFSVRQRGRIVYLLEDLSLAQLATKEFPGNYQDELLEHINLTSVAMKEHLVTVNGVSLGVTEDFILRHCPRETSIKKSLAHLQETRPGVRLVENTDISCCVAYLSCVQSASITGQILRLTHGL